LLEISATEKNYRALYSNSCFEEEMCRAFRPEQCNRLAWEKHAGGRLEVFKGKRKASRRHVPLSTRVLAILDRRTASSVSDSFFSFKDLNTTLCYIHLNDDEVRTAKEKAEQAKGRRKIENKDSGRTDVSPLLN
jgi:hypothetical protein